MADYDHDGQWPKFVSIFMMSVEKKTISFRDHV